MSAAFIGEPVTRAEHLRWAKDRALAYADRGDVVNTLASLTSDLRKHPETEDHPGPQLGLMLAMAGALSTPHQLRDWVEGFN